MASFTATASAACTRTPLITRWVDALNLDDLGTRSWFGVRGTSPGGRLLRLEVLLFRLPLLDVRIRFRSLRGVTVLGISAGSLVPRVPRVPLAISVELFDLREIVLGVPLLVGFVPLISPSLIKTSFSAIPLLLSIITEISISSTFITPLLSFIAFLGWSVVLSPTGFTAISPLKTIISFVSLLPVFAVVFGTSVISVSSISSSAFIWLSVVPFWLIASIVILEAFNWLSFRIELVVRSLPAFIGTAFVFFNALVALLLCRSSIGLLCGFFSEFLLGRLELCLLVEGKVPSE